MAGASNVKGHHAEWVALLEPTGPFLSIPVLQATFPQGLDDVQPEVRATLRAAFEEWQEQTGGPQGSNNSRKGTDAQRWHQAWIRHVVTAVLGYSPAVLAEGAALPSELTITDRETGERRQPTVAVLSPGADRRAQLLIAVAPPGVALERLSERAGGGPSSASTVTPVDALVDLLRATSVPVGLVTNGEAWIAVRQAPDAPVGLAHFSVPLFLEEPLTLRAFVSLFGQRRLLSVPDDETLAALYIRSAGDLHEVADQLGRQVRHAIEVLLQALERADRDSGRTLLAGWTDAQLYEAALTVMMRLVFLFFAEEQDPPQLPMESQTYAKHYAASTLRAQLREHADKQGEEVLERRTDAWARLLATFRAVFAGVTHDRMRLVAHGGALFDPDRFPFLEGRAAGTSFRDTPARPLPIDNRATLHLLEALQILREAGGATEARRLSFRGLDVEQIGTIYEGLLDHKAARAPEATLGLRGSTKAPDPNLTLAALEAVVAKGPGTPDALVTHLHEATGRSESALRKALADVPSVGSPDEGRLRVACQNDEALLARVRPFAGLLRVDTLSLPVVWPQGAIHVAHGQERRQTGTHYTPQSLAAEVVKYALEPLIYTGPRERLPPEQWTLKDPRALLSLRVCDPAMGSGAFLVQVCRQLGDALLRAWGPVESGAPRTLPFGDPADAAASAELLELDPEARRKQARRLVADRCLYGVDKNPLAAEMAKLSLWLLTLRQGMPFTFVDHALQSGDSLLGVASLAQFERLSLSDRDAAGAGALPLLTEDWKQVLDAALARRRHLIALSSTTVAHVAEKDALLKASDAQLATLRAVGDLVAGAALASTPEQMHAADILKHDADLLRRLFAAAAGLQAAERALSAAQTDAARVQAAYTVRAAHREAEAAVAESRERARALLQKGAAPEHGVRRPFHWVLAFPEVLLGDRPGFDVIVGNPPFIGGQKLTGPLGVDYREALVDHVGGGLRGSADICAYFFRRAGALVAEGGVFGLLATNTIAQGDTREVGLDVLAGEGTIYRAVPSRKWPGEANLEIVEVWWQRGGGTAPAPVLGGVPVGGISPYLTDGAAESGAPVSLARNAGLSFIGSYVLGMGFTMTPEEAQAQIAANPWNEVALQPYLNGEDLNRDPEQRPSRWVINFRDWPQERAAAWEDLFRIVVEKVKPERDRNNRETRKKNWWRFAETAPRLYAAIKPLNRVFAKGQVTNTHALVALGPGIVFSHKVIVFGSDSWSFYTALQSTFHEAWAWKNSSTMRTDLSYTPSDSFDTFPFPHPDPRTPLHALDEIGERYHTRRAEIMRARQLGLTKTYNLFHDATCNDLDIAELRALHVALDTAVRDAYDAALKADGGDALRKEYAFAELDLGHGFHPTKSGTRYTVSEAARRGILDRLLRLNRARAAAEAEAKAKGEAPKKPKTPRAPKTPPPTQAGIPVQGVLFGDAAPVQSSLFDLAAADTTGDTEQVRRALAAAGPPGLTRAELTARAALPEDRARSALDALLAARQAVREGQAKGTRYRLIGSANS